MSEQSSYTPYVEEVDKPVDYKRYFFLIRKNLYVILTFSIITITVAAIFVSKIPDKYRTSVQLLVERPDIPLVETRPGLNPEAESWSEDYYKTQVEIMESVSVMRQAVDELKLTSYYGTDDAVALARRIKGMIKVERLRGSRLFNIYVMGTDPQFVAKLANGVARAYIRTNFEQKLYYSKEIMNWLPDSGDTSGSVTIETGAGKMKQVSRAELIESLPAIQTDPTLRELRQKKNELEAEIEFSLRKYRHKHPVIVKQRSSLRFLEESIANEKKSLLERLKSEAEGRHQLGHARIIEEAPVPRSPLKSDRGKIILIAMLAQLAGTFLIIFLLDYFDDTIRSVEDMERKGLILPFLGPITLVKGKEGSSQRNNLASFHEKKSDIAESFRYLRVAINFSASPESLKTLVLTSCLPGEGKSFVSHNLAISLALDGNRTLLVDGDLRRPVLQHTFRIDNTTGLSNYLTSKLEFDDVVKESFVENLTVVGSGPISPNPGEILGSSRMKQFIQEAQKKFDRVIIDCPPLTGIGDGFILGSLTSHVIMVIASGRTPAELVKRTQSHLDKAGIKILGTILNKVDIEKERYGGYYKYYYHTYNRYYNREE